MPATTRKQGQGQPIIYTEPPGTGLVPAPLHFGTPGDVVNATALPVAFFQTVDTQQGKTDWKAKYYETDYVKQVGANYGDVGPEDVRSIKFLGQGSAFNLSQRTMYFSALGRGPLTTPQFNLMQPIPYWNVKVVTPQQLAAYESLAGNLVTQVPSAYIPAGPPNLYLGA